MKKLILSASSLLLAGGLLFAQPCSPVDTTTSGGILPLPCAKPGVNYNETTTVTLPTTTSVGPLTVYICQVIINDVQQLPPGSWVWELWKDGNQLGLGQPINLNPATNNFERACLRFAGSGTVEDTFNIKVLASARVHANNSCSPSSFVLQIDTAFYIPFEISASCSVSEEEVALNNYSFSVLQNAPNPSVDHTVVPFTLPRAGLVTFKVASLTGSVVELRTLMGHAGLNHYNFNVRHLPAGIYTYALTYQGKTVTRRFVHLGNK